MNDRGGSFLARHPLVATFAVMLAASLVFAVVGANLSWIGGALAGLRPGLPWLAAIAAAIAVTAAAYLGLRIAANWPKRLPSGVLQVGRGQVSAPLAQLHVPATAPQARPADRAIAELDAMVGLASVKQEINRLTARLQVERRRREQGLPVTPMSLHMVFMGPPGVGKTVVARALGQIYAAVGVLRRGHVVEVDREGSVAGYIGQTATKTLDRCKEALNGILFIDEAYALATGGAGDFGQEAISTVLKFMEDNRDRIVVIVAGYPDRMRHLLNSNPGLASRFARRIDFPPYGEADLIDLSPADGAGASDRPARLRAAHPPVGRQRDAPGRLGQCALGAHPDRTGSRDAGHAPRRRAGGRFERGEDRGYRWCRRRHGGVGVSDLYDADASRLRITHRYLVATSAVYRIGLVVAPIALVVALVAGVLLPLWPAPPTLPPPAVPAPTTAAVPAPTAASAPGAPPPAAAAPTAQPAPDAADLRALRDRAGVDLAALAELRARAEGGSAKAQELMATLYDPFVTGGLFPKDAATAVQWYRKAADQGNVHAEAELGYFYLIGKGVPQDPAEAARWDRMAADRGDAAAQNNLGQLYENGQGVPQDAAAALGWYRKAADQGNANAQQRLGQSMNSVSVCRKTPPRPHAGTGWPRTRVMPGRKTIWASCSNGGRASHRASPRRPPGTANPRTRVTPSPRTIWAGCSKTGRGGCRRTKRRRPSGSKRPRTRATPPPRTTWAGCTSTRRIGPRMPPRRPAGTARPRTRATPPLKATSAASMQPGSGVPSDLEQALTLFRRAAAAGDPDSIDNLAMSLEKGLGTPRDPIGAYIWYRIAMRWGNAGQRNIAALACDRLKAEISRGDLAVAQQAADNWQPRSYSRIGVQINDLTPDTARAIGSRQTKGVFIASVVSGSPAQRAGLSAQDVITAVNGAPVAMAAQVRDLTTLGVPGQILTLWVEEGARRGSLRTIRVQLERAGP